MSIVVLNEVLDSSLSKSTARTLLIVLAEQAHEDGVCWPGIERLARRVNTSERNIQLLTRELEELGELIVEYAAGRGNTNRYRVLPPSTLDRLLTELTERLEKVKNSAEKVKISALLGELEKVKSRAEKVKDSAQKVKSSVKKVKRVSPEPSRTVMNQQEPNDDDKGPGKETDLPEHPEVGVVGSPEPGALSEDFEEQGGQGAAAPGGASAANASRSQVGSGDPATGDNHAHDKEKIPGGGAARAALVAVLAPWKAGDLLAEFPARQGWLELSPARIRELHDQARAAKGNRFRGLLIEMLDDEARQIAPQHPPDSTSDDAVDMAELMRFAPTNGISTR